MPNAKPIKQPEYRIVMALLPLEAVEAHEKALSEMPGAAFVTVRWSDMPMLNEKATTEAVKALNDAYCPK